MDERTAATKHLARQIFAECAPGDLTAFDDTVDDLLEDLPELRSGGAHRDKPTEFGGAVFYTLSQLAVLLAGHLLAALPGAAEEALIAKVLEKVGGKRRERRRGRDKAASATKELLTVQVISTSGEHAATEVRVVIGEQLYPAAWQSAIALLEYAAKHGADSAAADAGDEPAHTP